MSQVAEPTAPTDQGDLTAGFDSLDRETRVDRLPLEGRLPDWLQGSLVRTGPAKWEVGERTMSHWFDGFAMLHRFGIADGEVSYANRFLQTKAYRAAEDKGEIVYSECGRLAEAGYLSERREESGRRRRIYRLTKVGSEALDRWRAEPTSELYELRDAGLLKLYFGADPAKLADDQLEAHKEKLREYERQLEECQRLKAPPGTIHAIEAGIGHEREYVRFWSKLRS